MYFSDIKVKTKIHIHTFVSRKYKECLTVNAKVRHFNRKIGKRLEQALYRKRIFKW